MRTFLLITIFAFPSFTFGQVNHFSNPASKWNVVREYPNPTPQDPYFVESKTKIYGFSGDTTVNGSHWNKMFWTYDSTFLSNLNFVGFVRSANGYVFKTTTFNSLDTIYNFNLSIGDSVFFDLPNKQQYIPITQKDSIFINGQYYDRLQFAEPVGVNTFTVFGEVWIEDIGSIYGPLFPLNPKEFSTEMPDELDLTCTNISSLKYWSHPSYNQCIINNILNIENHLLSGFKVFPNPFSGKLSIELSNYEKTQITMFNSFGQKILQHKQKDSLAELDLSNLKSGLYILEVRQNEKVETIKLIKN